MPAAPRRRSPRVLLMLLAAGMLAVVAARIRPSSHAPPAPRGESGAASDFALCSGLVQDHVSRALEPLRRPALGEVVLDPQFGTKIRRITAVSPSEGGNAVIKPMYSTVQAWNADESKLILWHRGVGHELYDGRSYERIRTLPLVSPTDIEQLLWDPTDPDVLYYPSNYNAEPNFMRYRVSTDTSEVVRRFDFCPVDWARLLSLGSDPGYLSWGPGATVVGLQCGAEKFLYDVATDTLLGRTAIDSRNAPQPGPSGQLAYLDGAVYDQTLTRVRALDLANPHEHASLGRAAASGHDTYYAVAFDAPPGARDAAYVGSLVAHDMETGEHAVIIGRATGFPYPPGTTHVSAVAHARPGWVALSIVGHPRWGDVLEGELLLAQPETGIFCRVARHRSWAHEGRWGYWGEPHVVISPSATRLLFGSDWGDGDAVDSYVVELPSYR